MVSALRSAPVSTLRVMGFDTWLDAIFRLIRGRLHVLPLSSSASKYRVSTTVSLVSISGIYVADAELTVCTFCCCGRGFCLSVTTELGFGCGCLEERHSDAQ